MIGKASELKSETMDANSLNSWLANSPTATVIDIKVCMIYTDHYGVLHQALVIYKEDKHAGL